MIESLAVAVAGGIGGTERGTTRVEEEGRLRIAEGDGGLIYARGRPLICLCGSEGYGRCVV